MNAKNQEWFETLSLSQTSVGRRQNECEKGARPISPKNVLWDSTKSFVNHYLYTTRYQYAQLKPSPPLGAGRSSSLASKQRELGRWPEKLTSSGQDFPDQVYKATVDGIIQSVCQGCAVNIFPPTPILQDLSASCVRPASIQLEQLPFKPDCNPLDIFPDPDLVSFQHSLKGQMIQRLIRPICTCFDPTIRAYVLLILTYINNLKEQRSSDLCGRDQWGPSVCYCADSRPDGAAAAAAASAASAQIQLHLPAAAALYFSCAQRTFLFSTLFTTAIQAFLDALASLVEPFITHWQTGEKNLSSCLFGPLFASLFFLSKSKPRSYPRSDLTSDIAFESQNFGCCSGPSTSMSQFSGSFFSEVSK